MSCESTIESLQAVLNKLLCMCRYVASELATDITVNVGDVKFHLHKVL